MPKGSKDLVTWARRALYGLDNSACFVGVMDDRPMNTARVEFTLQLGHAVLMNKPIIIPVPFGVEIPSKLAAVADRVVRYDPEDLETLKANLTVIFTEMGINPQ
jgi:hypothetical protein